MGNENVGVAALGLVILGGAGIMLLYCASTGKNEVLYQKKMTEKSGLSCRDNSQSVKSVSDSFLSTKLPSVNRNLIESVDVNDINSDGHAEIVIGYNSGDKTVFYNTGNGYATVEQIKQREIERIGDAYRKQLADVNDFYKKAYGGRE